MDIQVEDISPVEQVGSTSPSPSIGTDTSEHHLISRHFGIDMPDTAETGKLKEIWEYGKGMSKTGDVQDVIWQIIHLQRTLGAPRLGESPLDKVYRWAKLKRQERNIQEELKNV